MNRAVETLLGQLRIEPDSIVTNADAVLDAAVATDLLLWMLARAGNVPAAEPVLTRAANLHAHERDGGIVAAAEWRGLRRDAAALAETPSKAVKLAGVLAEAAAWSLSGSSRSALTDVHAALVPIVANAASAATGWTAEDQADAMSTLEALVAEGLERTAIARRFAIVNPELEGRFVRQLDAANAAALALGAEIATTLRDLAGARDDAPSTTPRPAGSGDR